jgi:hypothetical protein
LAIKSRKASENGLKPSIASRKYNSMRRMKKRCDKLMEKRWENKLENQAIKESQS